MTNGLKHLVTLCIPPHERKRNNLDLAHVSESFTRDLYEEKVKQIRRAICPSPIKTYQKVPIDIHQDEEWIVLAYGKVRRSLEHQKDSQYLQARAQAKSRSTRKDDSLIHP